MNDSEATLESIVLLGAQFFGAASGELKDVPHSGFRREDLDYYWAKLSAPEQSAAEELRRRLMELGKVVARVGRASALVDEADLRALALSLKGARSALRMREFYYRRGDAIHDEGQVLGYSPAEQGENWPLPPARGQLVFDEAIAALRNVLELADASGSPGLPQVGETASLRYRSNTAFVMMWMADERPELDDVRDTVRSVFREFGIEAVRADEIEHSDMITRKILDAIATSEVLFADLTGSRPSVYYEVGYAHALGKRVVLFRKSGTDIHFDLAGYNCPEYRNLAELRKKLRKRLEALTGRRPAVDEARTD